MANLSKRGWVQSSPVNFNPKWVNRFTVRHIAVTHGKIVRRAYDTAEMKNAAREALKPLAGRPCAHGETLALKGSCIKNKGGVMPRALMG